jgi:hypothetical protein
VGIGVKHQNEKFHSFFTLAPDGGEWSVSGRGSFTPGKGPQSRLDAAANIKIICSAGN